MEIDRIGEIEGRSSILNWARTGSSSWLVALISNESLDISAHRLQQLVDCLDQTGLQLLLRKHAPEEGRAHLMSELGLIRAG